MVFWLQNENGYCHYLLGKNSFLVGSQQADIVIPNDTSISPRHAILYVTNEDLTLKDCGSKHGTFVDGEKQDPDLRIDLRKGAKIKFGTANSIFSLGSQEIKVIISNIKRSERNAVTEAVNTLRGTVLDEWKPDCTFLVIKEIVLTPKVLTCVIGGTPAVTSQYITDLVCNVKQNLPPPDPKDYKPPFGEAALPQNSVNIEYRPERKTLFADKVFVFTNPNIFKQMKGVIKFAGGKAMFFDGLNLTIKTFKNSTKQYLMINDSDLYKSSDRLKMVLGYLKRNKQRLIPLQEIAVAILNCSCSTDCNPEFNRAASVMEKTDVNFTYSEALVLNTQSQISQKMGETLVVPQSYENDLISYCPPSLGGDDEVSTVKREGDVLNRADIRAKVSKIREAVDVHGEVAPKQSTNPNSFVMAEENTTLKRKLHTVEFEDRKAEVEIAGESVSSKDKSLFKRPKLHSIASPQAVKTQKEKETLLSKMSTITAGKSEESEDWVTIGSSRNDESKTSRLVEDLDPKVKEFIDSFKNSCHIRVMNCSSRISNVGDVTNFSVLSTNFAENFKKFRKNPEINVSNGIVPRKRLEKVVMK